MIEKMILKEVMEFEKKTNIKIKLDYVIKIYNTKKKYALNYIRDYLYFGRNK
ncbi:MAG: hypothetical protein ACFFG0_02950 [Candidatus Thorarchaeota archaeon]